MVFVCHSNRNHNETVSRALTRVAVRSHEPGGSQWNQNPVFLGKAAPEDPREHSELQFKRPQKTLPSPLAFHRESIFKVVSQKQAVPHPVSGRRPPPLPNLPPLAAGPSPQLGGSWGRRCPTTEAVDTAPLHQWKPLAMLQQRSATLLPKEPFPG